MSYIKRRQFLKGAIGTAAMVSPYSRMLGTNGNFRVAVIGFNQNGKQHTDM